MGFEMCAFKCQLIFCFSLLFDSSCQFFFGKLTPDNSLFKTSFFEVSISIATTLG